MAPQLLSVFLACGTLTVGFPVIAQEVERPFQQESSKRTAFVSGMYKSCMRERKEDANHSTSEHAALCLCYGRQVANLIDETEARRMMNGQILDSLSQKFQMANAACVSAMSPLMQESPRDRRIVELMNACVREYFPLDVDYSAAVVRHQFCTCFSESMVDTKNTSKIIAEYCSSKL
jgi:hypothetical protein